MCVRKTLPSTKQTMNATLVVRKVLLMSSNIHLLSSRFLKSSYSFLSSPPVRICIRSFSSNGDSIDSIPKTLETFSDSLISSNVQENHSAAVDDVSTEDLKLMIGKYFQGDEEVLPSIFESILRRKRLGNHEESDEELMEDLQLKPLEDVSDDEFESDFDAAHETDEEIQDLCNAREYTMKKMMKNDEHFNMTFEKWNEIIKKGTEKGILRDTTQSSRLLENLRDWDDVLPDELKQKVRAKLSELGGMCERGEIEQEEAESLLQKFEDEMVKEYGEKMEAGEVSGKESDDPPGEGPILRWQTRVVLSPGEDAWHPKNRKVKMSITVKELGLSKYQFLRLKEIVGKRYEPGNDELTITSERFEYREENRKDCLRTLYALVEEAEKADKLVEEARTSFVKHRLRSNPAFMERLLAKKAAMNPSVHG